MFSIFELLINRLRTNFIAFLNTLIISFYRMDACTKFIIAQITIAYSTTYSSANFQNVDLS